MFRIHTLKLIYSNLTELFVHKQISYSPGFTSFRNVTLLSSNLTSLYGSVIIACGMCGREESAGAPAQDVWQETQYVTAHGRILK